MAISSENSKNERRISQTVKGASERLSKKDSVTATEFAREILSHHVSDYGAGRGRATLDILNNAIKSQGNAATQPVAAYLASVSDLYNDNVDILDGRHMIVGLSLLDSLLLELLRPNGFLQAIINELADLNSDFTPKGLQLFGQAFPPTPTETAGADQVQNWVDTAIDNKAGDQLDRYSFAEFLVKLLNHTQLDLGSYALHLYAPWGAGKSTVINFMKEAFKQQDADANRWYLVEFNAWQNQRLTYPWWTLMKSIRKAIRPAIPWKRRFNDWLWRFKISRLSYLLIAVALASIILAFILPQILSGNNDSDSELSPFQAGFETISKIVAAVTSIAAFVIGLNTALSTGSQKAAKSFIEAEEDPMATVKDRFGKIVRTIHPARIVVFIDDLDRCKSAFVVELLENIQTLFKEANVVFVVAADVRWINACYEVEYAPIKSYVVTQGKPIGPLFVEKMFQLSVPLPGAAADRKQRLWSSLLNLANGPAIVAPPNPVPSTLTVEQRENLVKTANSKPFNENHAIRLEMVKKLADDQALAMTQHFLTPYSVFLDLNPRSMRRLLNSYTVNKATSLITHIDLPAHQLTLWTILTIRWPMLADYLLENPDRLSVDPVMVIHPEPMKTLWEQPDVQLVIGGGVLAGGGLSVETVRKCRALFV